MTLRNLSPNRPSVTLNFKRAKKLDPRITFTRASYADDLSDPVNEPSSGTGTSGGKIQEFNINVPRLTNQGLLIEESRTNRVLYSQDMGNSAWRKDLGGDTDCTVTANAAEAPDGTNTANLWMPVSGQQGTANEFGYLWQNIAQQNTSFQILSFYAKAKEINKFHVRPDQSYQFNFDLTNAPFVISNSAGTWEARDVGNGWFYCVVKKSGGSTATRRLQFGLNTTDSTIQNGTNGMYFWGVQHEFAAGNFPTSYIPTSGATVTRAADVCSITGTNISNWYGNTEGAFVMNASLYDTNSNADRTFIISTNGSTEMVGSNIWSIAADDIRVNNLNAQVAVVMTLPSGETIGRDDLKIAFGYQANDPELVVNIENTTVSESTSSSETTYPATIGIGHDARSDTNYINGYLRSITYYPTRLPDTALQALTT